MRYEKSCGAVVFRIDEGNLKILLLKHINGGHWGLPKGHVEEGESEEETAIREIYEETGIEVVNLYRDFRYEMEYSPMEGVTKKVIYFIAKASYSVVKRQIEEIQECLWVDSQVALDMVTYDNTKKLLFTAIEFIRTNYSDKHLGN